MCTRGRKKRKISFASVVHLRGSVHLLPHLTCLLFELPCARNGCKPMARKYCGGIYTLAENLHTHKI